MNHSARPVQLLPAGRQPIGVTILLLLCASACPVSAGSVAPYSVFAHHAIVATGGITAPSGVIGSNGDIFMSGGKVHSVLAGKSLITTFGTLTTTGDVTANRNGIVTFFGSIGGNLNAGGDVNLTADVAGNIVAGESVRTTGDTTGDITAGGGIEILSFGTVGGTLHPFSAVSPATVPVVTLPAPHLFSTGGPAITLDTFDAVTLSPGSFGDMILIGSNEINLTAGNYYFNDIRSYGSFSTFNFDTTDGPIGMFVKGEVFLVHPEMNLNGVSFKDLTAADASQVYWETHDDFRVEFASVLGTVYAPFGDIQIMSLSKLNGRLVAGGDIIMDGGDFVAGAAAAALQVPEPGGFVLATAGLALVVAGRRRLAAGEVRGVVSARTARAKA